MTTKTPELIPFEKVPSIEELLSAIRYENDIKYIPSEFAIKFVNFIKLVNDGTGEENITPVLHYRMLDAIALDPRDIVNLVFRGAAKTTVFAEYLFLYIAVYGELPIVGKLNLAIYVSDTIENGVANMHRNLKHRYENSAFLQKYLPKVNLTQTRWEFTALDGRKFIVKGYGALTGVRGTKELGKRPQLAVLDDLMSDEVAKSPASVLKIRDTVDKAIEYALHPKRKRVIWSGTPFNKKDPLYVAVESGAYAVNVFPVCNKFPCSREEFHGAWEDRFSYDYVFDAYNKAKAKGNIPAFNQELMLKIRSDDDKLIPEHTLKWASAKEIIKNRNYYNFYITTDFATSEKESADFSIIMVWAVNHAGKYFLVDGYANRAKLGTVINELFKLVQKYRPRSVGVETSGQQKAFISWLETEMIKRNIWFDLATGTEDGNGEKGIRPNTNKFQRFMMITPWFNLGNIIFCHELKETPLMVETLEELDNVTVGGFKSLHDDACDGISMLQYMFAWFPSMEAPDPTQTSGETPISDIWGEELSSEQHSTIDNYVV